MNYYILSHPRLTKSAKPLAARISEISGNNIIVYTEANRMDKAIIRYGNSSYLPNEVNFNSPEHIKLAGNKLRLSEFLSGNDAEEEKITNLSIYHRTPEENEFPVVLRKELNRGGGIGIVVCKNMEQFRANTVDPLVLNPPNWTHWYDFQFELGVHILGGEIKRVFKKIRTEGLEEEEFPIRNTQRGYEFRLRNNWQEKYSGLTKFVKKLYEVIPIQFARLDIGYDKETGGYRLIEINSAPDLSQNANTLNLYAEFLARKVFDE